MWHPCYKCFQTHVIASKYIYKFWDPTDILYCTVFYYRKDKSYYIFHKMSETVYQNKVDAWNKYNVCIYDNICGEF